MDRVLAFIDRVLAFMNRVLAFMDRVLAFIEYAAPTALPDKACDISLSRPNNRYQIAEYGACVRRSDILFY